MSKNVKKQKTRYGIMFIVFNYLVAAAFFLLFRITDNVPEPISGVYTASCMAGFAGLFQIAFLGNHVIMRRYELFEEKP